MLTLANYRHTALQKKIKSPSNFLWNNIEIFNKKRRIKNKERPSRKSAQRATSPPRTDGNVKRNQVFEICTSENADD